MFDGAVAVYAKHFQTPVNIVGDCQSWIHAGPAKVIPSRPALASRGLPVVPDMAVGADGQTREFYNSSFLIGPDGRLANGYRKRNLVIFGEYVPLARWLPFMKFFTPIPGGFTPGKRAASFELGDLKVKTSPLICFEDVFPQLARDCAEEDTDFLVNMTNDGWFGESGDEATAGTAAQ